MPGACNLDGLTFISKLVNIVEAGSTYLTLSNTGEQPVEAVCYGVMALRGHLFQVGFMDQTVCAGADALSQVGAEGNIAGRERALIKELL